MSTGKQSPTEPQGEERRSFEVRSDGSSVFRAHPDDIVFEHPAEPQGDVVDLLCYCDQCERGRHEAVVIGDEGEESLCAECLLARFNALREDGQK
jgi:hypothetical protein